MTRSAALFVAGIIGLVACARGDSSGWPPAGEPIACAPMFEAPTGFEALGSFEEEYPDHVGVRLGYRDQEGRELHAFAGIPGEFGEGLPDSGDVALTHGRTGDLFGHGNVWVLVWDEGGPCDPRAVLANGFDRRSFLACLERSGIVAPE
ncbi:MAG TPA: hypothetical protein VJ913_10035 [Actinomycetota bacterium]|nr:hypothetical protein [Actinomycetota bacterium]